MLAVLAALCFGVGFVLEVFVETDELRWPILFLGLTFLALSMIWQPTIPVINRRT
jgi:drug/metabolite transporter (DMT)-like permease